MRRNPAGFSQEEILVSFSRRMKREQSGGPAHTHTYKRIVLNALLHPPKEWSRRTLLNYYESASCVRLGKGREENKANA